MTTKMQVDAKKIEIARQLQARIDAMQGLGNTLKEEAVSGLYPFADAFPGQVFPRGATHEFISYTKADAASTAAFITALAGKFMKEGGLCLWIGSGGKVFPAGLKPFGLEPDRVVFVDPPSVQLALWAFEEALKCKALSAVVGEIRELGFTESRRLQLAVERSGVSGFIHRHCPQLVNPVACTTRWEVRSLPGMAGDALPGVDFNYWDVRLLKVRNGKPHSWQVRWSDRDFVRMEERHSNLSWLPGRNAG